MTDGLDEEALARDGGQISMVFRWRKNANEGKTARGSLKRSSVEETTSVAVDSAIVSLGGMLPRPQQVANIERGKAALAEIDAAIKDHTVDLEHIVLARYLGQQADDPSTEDYISKIGPLKTFYPPSGIVIQQYYCTYIPAAVVLRRIRPERNVTSLVIDDVYLPEASRETDSDVEAGFWEARSCYLNARQCRGPRRRDSIVRDIFSVMINLLTLADAGAISGYDHERATKALPKIREDLRRIKAEIARALLIEARHKYLAGMFGGALVLGLGVIGIVRIVHVYTHVSIDTLGLGVAVAGGVGALLSVMTRLTANNLRVDPDAGPKLVLLAGSFRPVIGAIFAFVVYMFVEGGLIPIKVTATGLSATYFFLGIGFLAGFSERFAQDAVTRAGSVIFWYRRAS